METYDSKIVKITLIKPVSYVIVYNIYKLVWVREWHTLHSYTGNTRNSGQWNERENYMLRVEELRGLYFSLLLRERNSLHETTIVFYV
jgi:hypothetical protein